jgi:hypothetical protein
MTGMRTGGGAIVGSRLTIEYYFDPVWQIIAAIDYAIANKDAFNIRVINRSLGAGVYESYNTDPLTLAAKRAVGSLSSWLPPATGPIRRELRQASRRPATPVVLTVGATSDLGTTDRRLMRGGLRLGDRRPTRTRSPVAPGVNIESTADRRGAFRSEFVLPTVGRRSPGEPYLS